MKALTWLGLLTLMVSGCDPVYSISASAEVAEAPGKDCVVEALGNADTVLHVDADGHDVSAVIPMPEGLSEFPEMYIGVSLEPAGDGDHPQVKVYMSGVGSPAPPEFESYVQAVVDDLLAQILERCSPPPDDLPLASPL